MARIILVCGLVAASALAQEEVQERLDRLEKQNREILERLDQSKSENAALQSEVERMRAERAALIESEIESYLEETSGGAQGDTGLTTKGGQWWELYGFVRFDLYYNSAEMNSVILPQNVLAEGGAQDHNDNQYAFDPRLTRLGFNFKFGKLGNTDITAKLETDFANFPAGVVESRPTPRIRLAYIDLDFGAWTLRLGQDWDVIAALNASVNHELMMWNAGNLGDRRAMIQGIWTPDGKPFFVEVALGLTGAVSAVDLDADAEVDGFDSGIPHFQGRFGGNFDGWVDGKKLSVAVWGYAASLESDTPVGGEDNWTPWVVGFDYSVPITARLLLTGELWTGQALGDVRGNIGQTVNAATGQEIEGWGGWIELQITSSERDTVYVGYATDDPSDGDVAAGAARLNRVPYVGVRRAWSKVLTTAFDVLYWETQYDGGGLGNALRFNFWIAVNF